MAITLLQVVQDVSRTVGLDPTITAFSEGDETLDLVRDVNEARKELRRSLFLEIPFYQKEGTINLVASQRLYALETDASTFELFNFSMENETDGDKRIKLVTYQYVRESFPKFDTELGEPIYFYFEGLNQVGFYPVPDGARLFKYQYSGTLGDLSNTTDVFTVPDEWVEFIKKKARYHYEARKGYATAANTFAEAEGILQQLIVIDWISNPRIMHSMRRIR